jgi:ATP-dependent helicase/DNAse subunit B
MVIATRNPEDYSGIFREILPLHGIPVNITDRPKLTHSPLITAIFSILNLLIYQYQKKDIQKVFSSAYIRLPHTSAADMYRLSIDFELITRKERLKSEFSHYNSETYWLNQLHYIIAKYTHNIDVFRVQNDMIKVKEYEELLASATRFNLFYHLQKLHVQHQIFLDLFRQPYRILVFYNQLKNYPYNRKHSQVHLSRFL